MALNNECDNECDTEEERLARKRRKEERRKSKAKDGRQEKSKVITTQDRTDKLRSDDSDQVLSKEGQSKKLAEEERIKRKQEEEAQRRELEEKKKQQYELYFNQIVELVNSKEGQEFLNRKQVNDEGHLDPNGKWTDFVVIHEGQNTQLSFNQETKEVIHLFTDEKGASKNQKLSTEALKKIVCSEIVTTIEHHKQQKERDYQHNKRKDLRERNSIIDDGNSSDEASRLPSPELRQPIEAISLKEKARVFNIFNKQLAISNYIANTPLEK